MKQFIRGVTLVGASAALVGASLAITTWGQSSASPSAPAVSASPSPPGTVKAFAYIKIKDHGKVIYRHTYPASTAGTVMTLPKRVRSYFQDVSGNEGTSSASGTATVGVGQVFSSCCTGSNIWRFDTHVRNSWNRANHTVGSVTHWYAPYQGLDPAWDFNGIVDQSHHFFAWNCSDLLGRCGFHSMYQGKYTGPAFTGVPVHTYPHNVLEVHFNGTWYWSHTCCGPPGS